MTEEDKLENLAEISSEIFFEGMEELLDDQNVSFDWQVEKPQSFDQAVIVPAQQPEQSEQPSDLANIISSIKGKLDSIVQIFSNEVSSPQMSYLKALLTTDMSNFDSSLDQTMSVINQAVNLQQSVNIANNQASNGEVTLSEPMIISIPLSSL
jgi:hypothetical protein